MKTGRPKSPLGLTSDEVAQLQSVVASRSIPQGLAPRARMILLSHAGLSNAAIAQKLSVTNATVGKWRRRFVTDRLAGLHDDLRPGRPRTRTDEEIAALVQRTLRTKPKTSTQWSCRTMAGAAGSPSPRFTVCGRRLGSSPIGSAPSSSPRIPSLSRRCVMSSASI